MDILKIAARFDIDGNPVAAGECNRGHINSTYFVECDSGNTYVLQKINTGIFKNPAELMHNISCVTEHIRKKLASEGGDLERGTLCFRKADNGEYFIECDGGCYRIYDFVDNAVAYDAATPALLKNAGEAFGHFQMQLANFDASLLYETIPNFHNTVSRYTDFENAIAANAAGRADTVKEEIAFVRAHRELCSYIVDAIADGSIPLRVTHNDTKLNNILMDKYTGKAVSVIDLDTVMPGSVLYDFGDAIRFGASSAAEDERDLSIVECDLQKFEAFAEGFISGLGGSLTEREIADLPYGAIIITLETGIRFLTDYLNGDTYFRIAYPEHNLDRARNQFKLVSDMKAKLDTLKNIINNYI